MGATHSSTETARLEPGIGIWLSREAEEFPDFASSSFST